MMGEGHDHMCGITIRYYIDSGLMFVDGSKLSWPLFSESPRWLILRGSGHGLYRCSHFTNPSARYPLLESTFPFELRSICT